MPAPPVANKVRWIIDPADAPPEKVARRLHLTLAEFHAVLPNLLKRGFPPPDPDTGNYGLDAVDIWRNRRDRILPALTSSPAAGDDTVSDQAERFNAAKRRQTAERRRNGGAT